MWASKNGAPFELIAEEVTGATLPFTGDVGAGYRFAASARDRAGNVGGFSAASGSVQIVPSGTPPPPPPPPAGSSYAALLPARLLETRVGAGLSTVDGLFEGGGERAAGSVTELQVTGRGGVPGGAAAVVLNVTVVDAKSAGFVTVYPCGSDRPLASNLNFVAGSVVPNAVVSKIGDGGKVCLFTNNATQLLADVNGYFPAG